MKIIKRGNQTSCSQRGENTMNIYRYLWRWLSIFLCQVTLANLVGWYFPSERCLTLLWRHGESRHRRGILGILGMRHNEHRWYWWYSYFPIYIYNYIYMGYLWDLFNDCWWFINGEELEWLAWYNWKNSIPNIKHPHKPWFGRGSDNILGTILNGAV